MNTKKLAIHELSNGIKTLNSISIPEKVKNFAKRLIVDIFGVTLAGSNTDSSNIFYNVANDIYSSGKCKIIGRDTTINAAGAAFINGTSAHALDFDDNCYAGVVHGSAVVFPAVLSYAQHKNLPGDNLLKSFIIGLEVEFAVAKALSNSIYDKGWWTTSMLGSIGSTAGVVSLAGLGIKEIENALSIAISGVGAIRAVRGTNSKHYYCGKSAENGIIATEMALYGATGPKDVFEEKNGILSVLNDDNFEYEHIQNIGIKYSLIEPGVDIKKYPVCYASHSAVDGVASIINSENLNIDNISKIICFVPPIIESNLTYNNPKSPKEAQFSLQFALAVFVKFGSIKLKHLDTEYILDPEIKKLMNKIEMTVCDISDYEDFSAIICPEWTNIKIFTTNGKIFEKFVAYPIGSAQSPLTDKQIFRKFKSCFEFSKNKLNADTIYERLMKIENVKDCSDLF